MSGRVFRIVALVAALLAVAAVTAEASATRAHSRRGLQQLFNLTRNTPVPGANVTDDHDDHGHGAHGTEADSESVSLKIMSIFVIGGISLLTSTLVIFIPQLSCIASSSTEKIMDHIRAFSAGVFICVGVTHLLGDASDILLINYGQDAHERYRPAQAMAIIGYLAMLLIQKVIFGHDHGHDAFGVEAGAVEEEKKGSGAGDSAPEVVGVVVEQSSTDNVASPAVSKTASILTVAATMAAISIHSFVEGLALGMQTSKEGVILLFVAIFSHEWAEDIVVAAASAKTGYSNCVRFVISFILALTCPIGIGVGWALQTSVHSVAIGYILGFGAGTFIYIACTEIVSEQWPAHTHRSPWSRVVALFAGIGVLYAIMAGTYNAEAHNH